jgi:hypothetical protein
MFLYMRILKSLQTQTVEVLILQGLRADDFGQNTVKRGVCLEVRILKEIEEAEKRNSKLEVRNPERRGTLPLPRNCRRVRNALKIKDEILRFGVVEGADRRFWGMDQRSSAGRIGVNWCYRGERAAGS